jgi:O-antigen/teichoic acid export membrane protein
VEMLSGLRASISRVTTGDGLRAKATLGGAWLGVGSFVEQVSRFVRNLLLARLVAPSAFGAMAIVLSSSSLIGSLSDVGVWQAVIQNPRGGEDDYLNAAWWFGLSRAICIYAAVFVAAPWVAAFYGIADLSALLRVTLLATLLDGLMSPRAKLAQKEMKFWRWAAINNGGGVCGVVLTIGLSFVLRDVWALAIGYCAENGFRCILSYILFPGLPSISWDKQALSEIWKFSRGMLGLSFLNLVFARTDIFVLGKLYPPAVLGVYTMAVYLIQTPTSFLINMISTTLLPAFAHVQGDKERTNRILYEVTWWILILGLPAVATVFLCRSSLLTVTYGARYSTASGALAFAASVALLNTLNSLVTCLFFGNGDPALHRRSVAISAIIMVIAIYPACKYFGLLGGQVAALAAVTASYVLQVARARVVTGLRFERYTKALAPAALMSVGILSAGFGAHYVWMTAGPLANITIAAVACLIAYVACVPMLVKIARTA